MFVYPEKWLSDVEVSDVELLKVREGMQTRHRLGQQEIRLVDLSSNDNPSDEVNHPHPMEVVGSVESRGIQNREGSIEMSSGGDAPCAREVCAGEKSLPVF